MTAIKIIRELFPCDLTRDALRSKRRKKSESSPRHGMKVEGSEKQQNQHRQNGIISTAAPSLLVARALADNGLPDRIDPLSIEYLMEVDYDDGSFHSDIPPEILMAIQCGNIDTLTHHYMTRDRLVAQRNSQGETLLHIACRWGSVSTVKSLLCDAQMPVLVLDRRGRSPLHSLCLGMNSRNVQSNTNSPNCNHLESMRLLLREKSTLLLFKDKQGKVPLEYIQQSKSTTNNDHNNALLHIIVNEMLCSERTVEKVVEEMSYRVESSRSGRRLSALEQINTLLDFSGIQAAIMETGLSI